MFLLKLHGVKMNIADKIKYYRKNILNISQFELAKKMSVSRKTIANWEAGLTTPNSNNIIILSKLFGLSIEYMINENAEESLLLENIDDNQYQILNVLINYFLEQNEKDKK